MGTSNETKRKILALVLVFVLVITASPLSAAMFGQMGEAEATANATSEELVLPASGGWTVTFDANGGTAVPAAVVEDGRLVTKPESPAKDGYVFIHWFVESDFTSPRWDFATDRVTEDVTLYAMWEYVGVVNWVLRYHETFDFDVFPNQPTEWRICDDPNESHPVWGQDGIGFHDRDRRRGDWAWWDDPVRNGPIPPLNLPGRGPMPNAAQRESIEAALAMPERLFWNRMEEVTEFRKTHTFGEDGWLTVQQYTRADGETQPFPGTGGGFRIEDGRAVLYSSIHHDAATIASTNPLPPYYRVQVTVSNIDAGGRRIDPDTGREIPRSNNTATGSGLSGLVDPIDDWVDERGWYNGLPPCPETGNLRPFRSTGPWGTADGFNTNLENPSTMNVQDAQTNGMYFLGIVDYSNPRPNNNLFIHHRRKVVMDVNSHRDWQWSNIWCPELEAHVADGSRYVSMLWLSGRYRQPEYISPNLLQHGRFFEWFRNGNLFYSYTQVGRHYGGGANRMVDKYLPDQEYVFTIERTPEYYKMTVSGYFAIGGYTTYTHTKFHLPESDPTHPRYNQGVPTWRFNQTVEELQGWDPGHDTMRFEDPNTGEILYYDLWSAECYFPDYFFFGIPHINHYVASAEFSDIKLWVACDGCCDEALFPDVDAGHWGRSFVVDANNRGFMSGHPDGTFGPYGNVTRAQAAQIMANKAGVGAPGYLPQPTANPFHDVPATAWYAPAIAWVADNEIMIGHADGRFGPGEYLTREQFAVTLRRFADFSELDITSPEEGGAQWPFADENLLSWWAVDAARWANYHEIILGDSVGGTFRPGDRSRRVEAAVIVVRFDNEFFP